MNEILKVNELNEQIESLTIEDDKGLELSNSLAKKVNEAIKQIKKETEPEVKEAYAAHKALKAKQNESLKPYENAKKVIALAIGDYLHRKEEEKKQIEQFAKDFDLEVPEEAKVNLGGTHVRKVWKARIVDASKVPVSYNNHIIRDINMSALNEIAKFEEGKSVIEGVEFYQEETTVIR